jgi:PAS domain S-box-containing protein
MNVDIHRSFPRLEKFAAFLLEKLAEEFTRDYLDCLKKENLPLLSSDIIKAMTEEELFKSSLSSNIDNFLRPVSLGKGLESVVEASERWKSYVKTTDNPTDISISDLIIAYECRKLTLFKLLPLYEPLNFEMIKEIEDFTKDSSEISFQTFVDLFEQRLRDNEYFVQKIIDASPNFVFLFDLQKMKRIYVSKNIEQTLGYSVDQLETISDSTTGNLLHPDDRERMMNRLEQYKTSKDENFVFEYRSKHANGEWKWLRSYESVYKRDEKGLPTQIVGSVVDVTERKKAETELQRLNADLEKRVQENTAEIQESYQQVKMILESLPQMAWTATPDGHMDYFSKSWQDYLGSSFKPHETDKWDKMINPEDLSRIQEAWTFAIKNGTPFEVENRIKRGSDHTDRWFLSKAVPLKDNTGKIIKWVGTSTDIQEQKTITEDLEKKISERTAELMLSNVELTRTNRDLQQFAYVASHDLKEPLRMVSSYLQLLNKSLNGKLDTEQKEFMNYISSGADRMNALIRDLLNYSRIMKDPASLQKIDCNNILEIVKQNLTAIIEETGTEIKSTKLPVITGIESQLIQLFQNLIANAIKFRKKDTTSQIDIKAVSEPHEWLFSVKDNGLGIAPQFKDKIFIIFQRLHNNADYPGTGIGLSVCKKIVELYGGKIWFDSMPGEGTTFYFTIPKVIRPSESLF